VRCYPLLRAAAASAPTTANMEDGDMTDERDEQALLVLCTAPATGDVAAELARGLVESRLAACVNLMGPLRSFYRWQGQLQSESELQLVIKTRRPRYPELERWLTEHHPYEVPEILAVEIAAGAPAYLGWLAEQTAKGHG